MALKLDICGQTDIGLVRPNNEDSFHVDEKAGLLVVADGMGGHASGEVASRMAVDIIRNYFETRKDPQPFIGTYQAEYSEATNRLGAAIRLANMAIHDLSESTPHYHGMGTTVAAVLINDRKISIAHVGDSRVYLIRSQDIEQLTDDHSVAYEQVKKEMISAAEAAVSEMRNVLTRALGVRAHVDVDLGELALMPGDRLVLCSDGLYSMVPDEDILDVMIAAGESSQACRTLVKMANDNGGRDNVTVIAAHIMKKSWFASLLNIMKCFRR
jgi:serine/threonine protein phosphatase PrpC